MLPPLVALAPEAAEVAPSEKRAMPDYEGREKPGATPGEVLEWVPRVILFPIYLTTEYLIRWPLGAAIAGAERSNLPQVLYNFFFFGPDHKAGFAPLAFVDFGFNPSVGLYAFWDNAGFKGNNLRFHGSAWTGGWLAGVFTDQVVFGKHGESMTLGFSGIRRPDLVFYGVGPDSRESAQSRYGQDLLQGSLGVDIPLWRASRFQITSGVRSVALYHGHYGGDSSVEVSAQNGLFPLPPGFDRGYTAQFNRALAAYDNRPARPAPQTGVRVEAQAEQGSDVRRNPASGWIRYGGTLAGYWDIDGHNRVLSLSGTARFADRLGAEPIPFTELVSLGGVELMRGFYPGRLVGESATVGTLHYRWPIWVWLDGSLQASVGNVFDQHLDGWKASKLRFSSAIGIESVGTPDNSLELLFGIGSETFESGGKIDSFRVTVGTNRGF